MVLPLAAATPASASAPVQSCNETHQARILFWAVACAQPGQPVIGAFGTWRNVPITLAAGGDAGSAQASNYLRMVPNTEGGMFANSIEVGLYAEKTGATSSTYGPRWTELGNSGGKTKAITAGVNPTVADNTNHTYMAVRQASGDQWDVLYDFNFVGSTTDQLKVPRGNSNRIDIGLEVMGPQYVTIPEVANRVQFMAENKAWSRAAAADTAQVTTRGICGQSKGLPSDPTAVYAAPYCFNAKLTDATTFTQWIVSKPGPTTARPAPLPVPAAGKFNGVDQKALSRCLATDPDSCLASVPGLASCVQTAKLCNAAALEQAPSSERAGTPAGKPADFQARAAAAFGVPRETLRFSAGSPPPAAGKAVDRGNRTSAAADAEVVTVESSAPNHGLEHRGLTFQGFRATYSASTGRLLDACWGQSCRS
ncbi:MULTISPECIES: hypothetical protein [unclassified Streptomyces]|uniref:hypothetical protein n=1 Tax=unclassified Streptomyces TaxID=2593676 RepID=UPI003665E412